MIIRNFFLLILSLSLSLLSHGTLEEVKTQASGSTSVCTCQFETPISMGKYTREMTRFVFVVEGEGVRACCEATLHDQLPGFKETHKMTSSCPVWALLEIDTINSKQARELSCSMPNGVFAIFPLEEKKDFPMPFDKYYPNLKD